jgi:hypothetical protein
MAERFLTPFGDFISKLSWTNSTKSLAPSAPSILRLLNYASIGSTFATVVDGLVSLLFSSGLETEKKKEQQNPYDILPPSSIQAIRNLALDPFFHNIFPSLR